MMSLFAVGVHTARVEIIEGKPTLTLYLDNEDDTITCVVIVGDGDLRALEFGVSQFLDSWDHSREDGESGVDTGAQTD